MSSWKTQLFTVSIALALGACSSSDGKSAAAPELPTPGEEDPSEPVPEEPTPEETPVPEVPEGKVALEDWVEGMLKSELPDTTDDKPAILVDNATQETFAHLFQE